MLTEEIVGKKRHCKCRREQITPRSDEQEGPSLFLAGTPHQNLERDMIHKPHWSLSADMCEIHLQKIPSVCHAG